MKAAYDDIAEWYESEFLALQRSVAPNDQFADSLGIDRALVELLGAGEGLCLEVGCGTGIYAERIAQLGWTALGVDISSGMLGYAQQRMPVVQGDGCRLPFRDDSIPAVITVMTHTDIPDYAQMMREMARVLKPGGIFVHVGVHPCFCGRFADRNDVPNVLIHPGYLDSGWTAGHGAEFGELGRDGQIRDKVGSGHLCLAELLNLFPASGLDVERFFEGSAPTPITLSIRARG